MEMHESTINSMKILLFSVALITLAGATSLTGFDCQAGKTEKYFAYPLRMDWQYCPKDNSESYNEILDVQVLQSREITTHVYQCRIEIQRTVNYCDANGRLSIAENGEVTFIKEVGRDECMKMHLEGQYITPKWAITALQKNTTNVFLTNLAGNLAGTHGKCSGADYHDPYGIYQGVIVQGEIKIALKDYTVDIDLNTNIVKLENGVTCEYNKEQCLAFDGGNIFWDRLPSDSCNFDKYTVVSVNMSVYTTSIDPKAYEFYTITSDKKSYSLMITRRSKVCGYSLVVTEHPRIVIVEGNTEETFSTYRKSSRRNIGFGSNIQTKFPVQGGRQNNLRDVLHVNDKFVHFYGGLAEMGSIYQVVTNSRCLRNALALKSAYLLAQADEPEELIYYLHGPGYIGKRARDNLIIFKCIPTEIHLRETDKCYKEIPVSRGNKSYFLIPQSLILFTFGTEVNCPVKHSIGGDTYLFIPKPVKISH